MPGQPQQGSPPFEITQFLGLVSQSASIGDGVPGGEKLVAVGGEFQLDRCLRCGSPRSFGKF